VVNGRWLLREMRTLRLAATGKFARNAPDERYVAEQISPHGVAAMDLSTAIKIFRKVGDAIA
jgi:hypothetical protein